MTCSDCIHEYVCENAFCWIDPNDSNKKITCVLFKSKSRYIELPCAVGDTVWCIVDKVFVEPLEAKIYSITIQAEGIIMRCGVKGYYGVSYMATDIGKKFFKTKKEAEKALERSEGK